MMTDDLPPQGPVMGPSGQRPEQLQRLLSLDITRRPSTAKYTVSKRGSRPLKGPLRAVRLCLLSILLPAALVAGPLYLRYHVYGESMYPAAASDMRLLDSKVSTTWCQRQLVRVNTTFNAFLLPEQPQVEPQPVRLSMTRDLILEDDMKEYWAFYLLQNSTITVSTCVRYPGASLIVIRGHKHLHECAYIGDDSSEEDDEMRGGAIQEENVTPRSGQWPLPSATDSPVEAVRNDNEEEDDVNAPDRMRRLRPGVVFHATHTPLGSHELLDGHPHNEDEDLTQVVANLFGRVQKNKGSGLSSEKPSTPDEEAMNADVPHVRLNRLRHHQKSSTESSESRINLSSSEEEVTTTIPHNNSNTPTDDASSSEVFEEVFKKIQKLGPRGEKVLRRLNKQIGAANSHDEAVRERQEHLRKLFKEMMDQFDKDTRVNRTSREKTWSKDQGGEQSKAEGSSGFDSLRRRRRQIILGSLLLAESLNKHDEDADKGIEEVDLQADGIADHHAIMNQTDPLDRSHSEFWSSFSSSEEALLQCAGLVLNLPLTPNRACEAHHSESVLKAAGHLNTLTYRIPANGYYFFVFNSENEVQTNFLGAHFDLDKRVYNVSNPLQQCLNSTEPCSLSLGFFSSQKVVLELPAPLKPNDSSWGHGYVVKSTCEPRTALYLLCVISVPLLILIFAFQ